MQPSLLLTILGTQYFSLLANGLAADPIAEPCSPSTSTANVVCINNYGAVMPFPFFRNSSGQHNPMALNSTDEYSSTNVPSDPSFVQIAEADFVVFDRERGLDLLGSNPSNTYMFTRPRAGHEAPVYLASHDVLLFSQLGPPDPAFLPLIMVNLSATPPTLSEFLPDPPVSGVNGGAVHNGLIYWTANGGKFINGTEHRPGIHSFDFTTGKSQPLLNNYFGHYFSALNDIAVDGKGDIWFTDTYYGWFNGASDRAPQFQAAVWRFRPSTGAVNMVDDSVDQPNGIGFSPDYKTLYVADSGAAGGSHQQSLGSQGTVFDMTGKRNIYAYDVARNGNSLRNKRVVYQTPNFFPDGLKVARNGYIVTAAGNGLDIMDEDGTLLVRAQANYTVLNFAWTGEKFDTIWMIGVEGISELKLNLPGPIVR